MKDDYYWFWINNITGIANIKLRYLFKVFDTPEDIYKASDKMFEGIMGIKPDDIYSIKESRKSEYIYREYSELDKKNIKFTYPGKYNYPERLMNIYDYPYIIYYKGSLPQSDVPSVAIVGARNCTEYGRSVAGRFAEDFADMGIQVISGMALGIDVIVWLFLDAGLIYAILELISNYTHNLRAMVGLFQNIHRGHRLKQVCFL